MDPQKLLAQLSQGPVKNVAFNDLRRLVEAMGFELTRISGSHPYQIRQFLSWSRDTLWSWRSVHEGLPHQRVLLR